jgi:hypothetical protein
MSNRCRRCAVAPSVHLFIAFCFVVGGVHIQTYTAVGRECGVQIPLQSLVEARGFGERALGGLAFFDGREFV